MSTARVSASRLGLLIDIADGQHGLGSVPGLLEPRRLLLQLVLGQAVARERG